MSLVIRPLQAIGEAVVLPEASVFNEAEAQPLVEAMGAGVPGQGINTDGRLTVRKAAFSLYKRSKAPTYREDAPLAGQRARTEARTLTVSVHVGQASRETRPSP